MGAYWPNITIPSLINGKQYHVQTDVGVVNAANKLLLGFSNATGQPCYVTQISCSNTQTAAISGVVSTLFVRRGTSAITGGTTLSNVTSPALFESMRDPSFSIPSGFTWNTNGTLGGTIVTIESCRWTTDEVAANGTSFAQDISAQNIYHDVFDFCSDPLVIPNGYSLAVVCDANTTNGQTLVDFNIRFTT